MPIYSCGDRHPDIDPTAFIHPDAVVIGAVTIGAQASIWPTAVVRADFGTITIGARTSIQDGTVLHTSVRWLTVIGDDCVVGHNAHLEGAVVNRGTLIGSMSTCLHGVVIGEACLVGTGALLTEATHVPDGTRALGCTRTHLRSARRPRSLRNHTPSRSSVVRRRRNEIYANKCCTTPGESLAGIYNTDRAHRSACPVRDFWVCDGAGRGDKSRRPRRRPTRSG
jgi:carbonic anhydrase/acetyltransferase-like protein (isoleucine patch superfamily)